MEVKEVNYSIKKYKRTKEYLKNKKLYDFFSNRELFNLEKNNIKNSWNGGM